MFEAIDFMFIMEMVGTVAFAFSGAMVAIRKELDLLGVLVLGVTTAVGGGMIRDILIGIHPPVLFVKPVYVTVAIVSVLILFFWIRIQYSALEILSSVWYERILNLSDAIGLGVFTVVGVNAAIRNGYGNYFFLKIFLGVITGVGGGLLRDIMATETPYILKKHVYACASIAGAICYVALFNILGADISMVACTILVVIIRLLARHYKWNLPRAF